MTKKEIVKTICDRANKEKLIPKHSLTQLATKEIVQWTFEAIIETLVTDGRIELRNFGVFEVKQRKPRKARNPRTGERVDVEAKNVVTFQPGKKMEEEVKKYVKPAESTKKPRKTKTAKPAKSEVPHTPSSNGVASTNGAVTANPAPKVASDSATDTTAAS